MSHADLEALRAEYEAFSSGHFFLDVHPDFELKTPDRGIPPNTYCGPEEARQAFEDFYEPFEEASVEVEEFFESGDRIVAYFVHRARPRGSSALVEIRAGHLWTMRDGKPARLEIFPEREKALEAAGLSD